MDIITSRKIRKILQKIIKKLSFVYIPPAYLNTIKKRPITKNEIKRRIEGIEGNNHKLRQTKFFK